MADGGPPLRAVCLQSRHEERSVPPALVPARRLSFDCNPFFVAMAPAGFGEIVAIDLSTAQQASPGSRDLNSMGLAAKWAQSYARIQLRSSG
jgi:hypothetical protein